MTLKDRSFTSLQSLLHADSVAIVGISHPDRFGGLLYTNLQDFGYPGQIYGVNPRYDSLYDMPIYPSLSDLPHTPDCAILAVPDRHLLPLMDEAVRLGIRAAVIFGAALGSATDVTANNGAERNLQNSLAQLARQNSVAICGPNCMGFLSFEHRLTVSGYPVVPGTPAGNVAFISHSGSVFDSVWQNNRQIHFNYVVSSGNEIATTMADYMLFALQNLTTRVIALFLESVRDPQTFCLALEKAADRDVPIVALKVGRSEQGARLAQAHSGAMAGQDAAYDALFARYGVCRVTSLDEMMDTIELFATGMRPRRQTIAALLDSGGERAMLADLAAAQGLSFAPLDAPTHSRLEEVLEPGLEAVNPLDAWGTGNAYGEIYAECLRALDANTYTGLNVFAVDLMRASNIPPTYVDVVRRLWGELQNPLAFLVNLTSAAGPDQMRALRQMGIPVLMGTETGLRAIRHLFQYSRFAERRRQSGEEARSDNLAFLDQPLINAWRARIAGVDAASGSSTTVEPSALDQLSALQLLRAYGIRTPEATLANTLEEAVAVAERLGYPVALKTAAGHFHKSDAGGVHLDLQDTAQVGAAYRRLQSTLGPQVLVQQMVGPGVELFVGVVRDPQFGYLLSLGTGGIFVEILDDIQLLLLPVTEHEVRKRLTSLRGASLLRGVRGRRRADVEAVVRAIMRLATMVKDMDDLIGELDVNPLLVLPDGAVAVDALLIPATGHSAVGHIAASEKTHG